MHKLISGGVLVLGSIGTAAGLAQINTVRQSPHSADDILAGTVGDTLIHDFAPTSNVRLAALAAVATPSKAAADSAASMGRKGAGREIHDCTACPVMTVVPAGRFVMGSPLSEVDRADDEGPPHIVRISYAFAVGKYEVTFDEWDACVADSACDSPNDEGWGRGRRPVINISYDQAVGYIAWLSDKTKKKYRLLSEAEWEYAARAGTDTARYWGSEPDRACLFANVYDQTGKSVLQYHNWENFDCNDGFAYTAPVGSFQANEFGLYDMLGNVWEWVEDCYKSSYEGAPTDGSTSKTGDCSRRVGRGGSWIFRPSFVRSAQRFAFDPSIRYNGLGFRVARTIP